MARIEYDAVKFCAASDKAFHPRRVIFPEQRNIDLEFEDIVEEIPIVRYFAIAGVDYSEKLSELHFGI